MPTPVSRAADESAASEPHVWCTGRARFVDAELAALQRTAGDSAAWLEAFRRHGADAPSRVEGDFAVHVALPDGRAWLAVDRFAVRSLCWRVVDGRLRVDERADCLADHAPAAALDPQALFDYLYFHVVPAPRTVFAGVSRLPPAHCGSWADGRLAVAPYWRPRFEEPATGDFDALAQAFRGHVQAAVAAQLDGSKPACFLSGGTDSSTVAGMIGRVAGRPAATYSIGFAAEGYDEMAYARLAARHFGCEHHEHYVTPADLVASIPEMAAHYDQPFGNSSVLPAYHCARMAREDGVTRMLAGDGGDELFGGNARYAKQRVFGWYDRVPSPLRRSVLQPLLENSRAGRLPLLRKAASYVGQAKVPLPERLEMYNLLRRLGIAEVLTPGFLERIDPRGPTVLQRSVWDQIDGAGPLNRMLAFDWRFTLADADLPKVVGSTGLAGVSVGFPWLDAKLVDFSTALPPEFKLKGLKLRWFFKEALRGFLPDAILTKRKQGFGLPFGVWANSDPALQALASDSLRSLATRDIVRPTFIAELLQHRLPAHPGYYGEMVWILMMLEQWLRTRPAQADLRPTTSV